jgi:hypothetical protein
MPIPYGDDTIDDFVRAANQRYREAEVLLANGFNTGSVYLDGYVAELVLKAAGYQVLGHGLRVPIPSMIRSAVEFMMKMDIQKPAGQHDILTWAKWLVFSKPRVTGTAYPQQFGLDVEANAQVIDQFWHPNMRYRELVIAPADAQAVHAAAGWLLNQFPNM